MTRRHNIPNMILIGSILMVEAGEGIAAWSKADNNPAIEKFIETLSHSQI